MCADPPDVIEFYEVAYFPSSRPAALGPVGDRADVFVVVFRRKSAPEGVEVLEAPSWRRRVEAQDRRFLEGLLADWQNVRSDEAASLFERLGDLSAGIVRVTDHRSAPAARAKEMMAAALGVKQFVGH